MNIPFPLQTPRSLSEVSHAPSAFGRLIEEPVLLFLRAAGHGFMGGPLRELPDSREVSNCPLTQPAFANV